MNRTLGATLRHPLRSAILLVLGVSVLGLASAQAQDPHLRNLHLPAQSLASALRELAEKHQLQMVFSPAEVAGVTAPPLEGRYSVPAAMEHLLAGSLLTYSFNDRDTVVVKPRPGGKYPKPGNPKARAAESPAAPALEEITVTSERRRESLQKTFIALTAFPQEDLERYQIRNIMDLANQVPGVSIIPFAGNKGAPNLYIRGMGSLDTQTTKDTATGIYMDGVPVGRGTGLAADIADLERVEVLRGPQGTLYGRNTTAGAINFITYKPGPSFAFEQQFTLGNYDLTASRTRLNLPLTEHLFTRLAYSRSFNRGWVRNTNMTLPDQVDFNQEDKQALRWSMRLLATDRLTVDYSLDRSDLKYGNIHYQVIEGTHALTVRQEQAPTALGLPASDALISGNNLTLSLDLQNITLKSITAHRRLSSTIHQNYVDAFIQKATPHQTQTTQEFQLLGSTGKQRLSYVLGLFHFAEDADETVKSSFTPTLSDTWSVRASSTSTALYGQLSWRPPLLDERLQLTIGARETHDTRTATKTFISTSFDPAADGSVVQGRKRFRKLNPALTADYRFDDSISAYAKVTHGYRAGGFSTRSGSASFGQGFGPELVQAYELGLKSELLDGRLRLNVAAFANRYQDLQVDQARVPEFFLDTLNAAKARVQGLEIELTALVGQRLRTNFFYTLLDGHYDSYIDNGQDLASIKHMPNTPRHQGGAGIQYDLGQSPLGKTAFDLDYRWQTAFYSGPHASTLSPGYGVWNAHLQLADLPVATGRLRIAAWGKNLADKSYILATTRLGYLSAQFAPPRTLGLDVTYEY